jgi:hypothetical protein
MPGGSVYKDHPFNKETHISGKQHNTSQEIELSRIILPHWNSCIVARFFVQNGKKYCDAFE